MGDEGKGKVVDVLTPGYEMVARFQGGLTRSHAGVRRKKFILKSSPRASFRRKNECDRERGGDRSALFKLEVETLEESGHTLTDRLCISKSAPDTAHAPIAGCGFGEAMGAKLGPPEGIGPAYTDKISRHGLRWATCFTTSRSTGKRCCGTELLDQYDFEYDLRDWNGNGLTGWPR